MNERDVLLTTCAGFAPPGQRTRTESRKSHFVLPGSRKRRRVERGLVGPVCETGTVSHGTRRPASRSSDNGPVSNSPRSPQRAGA